MSVKIEKEDEDDALVSIIDDPETPSQKFRKEYRDQLRLEFKKDVSDKLYKQIEELRANSIRSFGNDVVDVTIDNIDFLLLPIALQFAIIRQSRKESEENASETQKNANKLLYNFLTLVQGQAIVVCYNLLELIKEYNQLGRQKPSDFNDEFSADWDAATEAQYKHLEEFLKYNLPKIIFALASILIHAVHDAENNLVKLENSHAYINWAFAPLNEALLSKPKHGEKFGSKRVVDVAYLKQKNIQPSLPECDLLTESACLSMPNTCVYDKNRNQCSFAPGIKYNTKDDTKTDPSAFRNETITKQEPTKQTYEFAEQLPNSQMCKKVIEKGKAVAWNCALQSVSSFRTRPWNERYLATRLAILGGIMLIAQGFWDYASAEYPIVRLAGNVLSGNSADYVKGAVILSQIAQSASSSFSKQKPIVPFNLEFNGVNVPLEEETQRERLKKAKK